MITPSPRTTRRRKKALALAASGASAALLMGGLAPIQAHAEVAPPGQVSCTAGEKESLGNATADCDGALTSPLAMVVDGVLGLVSPDLKIGAMLNSAKATGDTGLPGTATITGTGLSTATVVAGGTASSSSNLFAALAMAAAQGGGTAKSDAIFGVSLASGKGSTKTNADANAILGVAVAQALSASSASARSLPLSLTYATTFGDKSGDVRAIALGGNAFAVSDNGAQEAGCAAVFAQASAKNSAGGNESSCTSILFIFQENKDDGGHTWYAIKNPLSLKQVSPFGTQLADLEGLVKLVTLLMPLPPLVVDTISGKVALGFGSDLVRISTDDGFKIETDLVDYITGGFTDSPGGFTDSLLFSVLRTLDQLQGGEQRTGQNSLFGTNAVSADALRLGDTDSTTPPTTTRLVPGTADTDIQTPSTTLSDSGTLESGTSGSDSDLSSADDATTDTTPKSDAEIDLS